MTAVKSGLENKTEHSVERAQNRVARRSNTRRVQMELPPKSMERLEDLKEKLEATSYADVIKDAIRLLEFVVDEEDSGSVFLIKRKDSSTQELKIIT